MSSVIEKFQAITLTCQTWGVSYVPPRRTADGKKTILQLDSCGPRRIVSVVDTSVQRRADHHPRQGNRLSKALPSLPRLVSCS